MMKTFFFACFPAGTASAVKLGRLIASGSERGVQDRMSSRLIQYAAVLGGGEFVGWQMTVPKKGRIGISVFGTADISFADLAWAAEKTGIAEKCSARDAAVVAADHLYEICLPVSESGSRSSIGFGASGGQCAETEGAEWPMRFSRYFDELLCAMQTTGAMLRVTAGPADAEMQQECRKAVQRTFYSHEIDVNTYIGTPVQMRVLLRLPAAPSVRMRAVLNRALQSSALRYIGVISDPAAAAVWAHPLDHAPVLPDIAAKMLMPEPELQQPVIGIQLCREGVRKIPAVHKNPRDKRAVTIGRATDINGSRRTIRLGMTDLQRHYQIVGQTGTGKSTLLATVILSAIEQGHGLTFFDPHGTTIDTVLHALPEKYADRVRVVRIGDAENPVPLNIWESGDLQKEERNIADLCELFGDIFNPPGEVFCGPRYERWLSTFAKASIALLGRQASLESIAVLSQSRENMEKLSKALKERFPELAKTIDNEYVRDHSSDFNDALNWYLCKFQRLTSVEQLRKTLGAGTNALDFRHSIDTDSVTLIDLASPAIGTTAARIIGTIVMMQLWNAARTRKERRRTHFVVVDEAALFQTNPMPRMLAESRKFGISMVLCHQHTGQLTSEIRDALEANSANFSAFRLSPRDAALAAVRFTDNDQFTDLARLDAYNALTTLSVDGRQTAPFTLETIPVKEQKNGEMIAAAVEERSRSQLVKPYRKLRALTPAEILYHLDHPPVFQPDWMIRWNAYRKENGLAV